MNENEIRALDPFPPTKTSEQWAEEIKSVIRRAQRDGAALWLDRNDDVWCVRIGTPSSDASNDPILWSDRP